MLKSIGDAVIACDANGYLLFMNGVAEQLTGWTQEEAFEERLGDIFRIIHEETRLPVESPVDKVRRLGTIVGLANHTLLIRRDGTEVSIDDSGSPIHDKEGVLTGVVLVFRDITDKRRAERHLELLSDSGRALSDSLDFAATLHNIAQLSIRTFSDLCYFDLLRADGTLYRAARIHRDPAMQLILDRASSMALERTANHPVNQALERGTPTLVPHVDDAWLQSVALNDMHLEAIRALKFHTLLTVPVREGERHFGTLSFCRTVNPAPFDTEDVRVAEELAYRVAASLARAEEMAKKVEALQQLEQRESLLQSQTAELETIYRTAPIGLALFDPVAFRYLRLNDQQAAMSGMPASEILGKTLTEIVPIEGLREMFESVAMGKPLQNALLEGELPTQPGVHRSWTVNFFPVFAEDGSVQAITAAWLEITAQKRAEQALIQSEKIAAVGRLASSIAHEINNPLESITNLLYIARNSQDKAEIHQYLELADRELRRISLIASQTLRFYRQSTRPQAILCKALVESVLGLYQGRLVNSGVTVETDRWIAKPVQCFEGEIRQVLNNLVGNALDAMPHGGRLIVRSRAATDWKTGRNGLALTFADTGSGIAPSAQSKVFEPFFTTKGLNGTGLGLWISKEIVDKHQGRLKLRSSQKPGQSGTVFSLFLPFDAVLPDTVAIS